MRGVLIQCSLKKRQNTIDGIENVIISLYAKGMSVSDIEEQIREIYNFDLLTSAISRITDKINFLILRMTL